MSKSKKELFVQPADKRHKDIISDKDDYLSNKFQKEENKKGKNLFNTYKNFANELKRNTTGKSISPIDEFTAINNTKNSYKNMTNYNSFIEEEYENEKNKNNFSRQISPKSKAKLKMSSSFSNLSKEKKETNHSLSKEKNIKLTSQLKQQKSLVNKLKGIMESEVKPNQIMKTEANNRDVLKAPNSDSNSNLGKNGAFRKNSVNNNTSLLGHINISNISTSNILKSTSTNKNNIFSPNNREPNNYSNMKLSTSNKKNHQVTSPIVMVKTDVFKNLASNSNQASNLNKTLNKSNILNLQNLQNNANIQSNTQNPNNSNIQPNNSSPINGPNNTSKTNHVHKNTMYSITFDKSNIMEKLKSKLSDHHNNKPIAIVPSPNGHLLSPTSQMSEMDNLTPNSNKTEPKFINIQHNINHNFNHNIQININHHDARSNSISPLESTVSKISNTSDISKKTLNNDFLKNSFKTLFNKFIKNNNNEKKINLKNIQNSNISMSKIVEMNNFKNKFQRQNSGGMNTSINNPNKKDLVNPNIFNIVGASPEKEKEKQPNMDTIKKNGKVNKFDDDSSIIKSKHIKIIEKNKKGNGNCISEEMFNNFFKNKKDLLNTIQVTPNAQNHTFGSIQNTQNSHNKSGSKKASDSGSLLSEESIFDFFSKKCNKYI